MFLELPAAEATTVIEVETRDIEVSVIRSEATVEIVVGRRAINGRAISWRSVSWRSIAWTWPPRGYLLIVALRHGLKSFRTVHGHRIRQPERENLLRIDNGRMSARQKNP